MTLPIRLASRHSLLEANVTYCEGTRCMSTTDMPQFEREPNQPRGDIYAYHVLRRGQKKVER
jgi:hypothetical protein